jgi:hypothetical protein
MRRFLPACIWPDHSSHRRWDFRTARERRNVF